MLKRRWGHLARPHPWGVKAYAALAVLMGAAAWRFGLVIIDVGIHPAGTGLLALAGLVAMWALAEVFFVMRRYTIRAVGRWRFIVTMTWNLVAMRRYLKTMGQSEGSPPLEVPEAPRRQLHRRRRNRRAGRRSIVVDAKNYRVK